MRNPRISQRIADEQGWVLISATIITLLMLAVALVAAGLIDNSTHRTREQRERESALNVDEGVLSAQTLVMQTAWPSGPGTDATGQPLYYPVRCSSSDAGLDRRCPNKQTLVAANSTAPGSTIFSNIDQLANVSWQTKVRDNGGALAGAYDPLRPIWRRRAAWCRRRACTYDFNGDHEIWVQAQSTVRGKPRNVVARMRLELLTESLPRSAVMSGALSITNNGNHGGTPMIDASQSQVIVRCSPSANQSCLDADPGQIIPAPSDNVAAHDGPRAARALQAARDHRRPPLRGLPDAEREQQYDLSGAVVWVEGCATRPTSRTRS